MTPLCSNTAALNFAVWILAFMLDRTGLYHLAGMQPILDASNSLSGCDGQSIHWAERGKAGIHCHVAGTVQLKICTHICIHNYTADQEWRYIAIYMCRHTMVYGVDTAPHPLLRHTWRPSQCMPRTLLLHSQLSFLSASLSSKSRSGFALLVEVE